MTLSTRTAWSNTSCIDQLKQCDAIIISGDAYIEKLEKLATEQRSALDRAYDDFDAQQKDLIKSKSREQTMSGIIMWTLLGVVAGVVADEKLRH